MQIRITFAPNEITLPLSYHHGVQSMLYRAMPDRAYASFLHERGFLYGGRSFKGFCFSRLQGRHQTGGGAIRFTGGAALEVRGIDPRFIQQILTGFAPGTPHTLCGAELEVRGCVLSDRRITEERAEVRMASPLTVYRTQRREEAAGGRKWTEYLGPTDPDFARLLADNAEQKWKAWHQTEPPGRLEVTPVDVDPVRDKVVAKFTRGGERGDAVTAWKGTYRLAGPAPLLDFLYHTGLGAKNSSGFGLFDLL